MSEADTFFMCRAIEIAELGRISTAPNPWVGCVLVKDGNVVSEGYHKRKGGDHAEICALKNLESLESARGATAYVTLEPCCHYGATPPCADALIKNGISRVVVAIGSDPDQNVNGGGVDILRQAGIEVVTGVCETQACKSLRPYLFQRETGMPYVVAKVGASLNGLIAYQDGTSKWITSEASREQAMLLRVQSQAILVGVGTAIADNPRLTIRSDEKQDRGILKFTRVIIDPSAKLSSSSYSHLNVLSDGQGPTLIFTTTEVAFSPYPQVEWIKMGSRIDLRALLRELGKRGIIQLMVEGGPTTLTKFMNERLVNCFTVFMAPKLIGHLGKPFFIGTDPKSINSEQLQLVLESVEIVPNGEGDIRVDYTVQ
jgi:diaminohydroxyphosphoribosylaminopyrimidine deaminase/5-amino-6-(5-phosphoribosylamino)uracil reductase